MIEVLVALGSNVGNREENLRAAVKMLRGRIEVLSTSAVYETKPMYVLDQSPFLNAALLGKTDMSPLALLQTLKELEQAVGRKPTHRYGPREIDLDLIAYGVIRYSYREQGVSVLEVPHCKVAERRFVLAPLADVAPNYLLPGVGRVIDLLEQTNDQAESVVKVHDAVF